MKPKIETVADILKRRSQQKIETEDSKETKKANYKISLIEKRQQEQKGKLIEEIGNVYIPSIACQKTNISRATLYRWLNDDYEFRKSFTKSQINGRSAINDLAESKLIGRIKNDDTRAMMFWLTHMHPNFINPTISISEENTERKKLSPEYLVGLAKRLAQWKNDNLH
jgi:ribosomal protein S16